MSSCLFVNQLQKLPHRKEEEEEEKFVYNKTCRRIMHAQWSPRKKPNICDVMLWYNKYDESCLSPAKI